MWITVVYCYKYSSVTGYIVAWLCCSVFDQWWDWRHWFTRLTSTRFCWNSWHLLMCMYNFHAAMQCQQLLGLHWLIVGMVTFHSFSRFNGLFTRRCSIAERGGCFQQHLFVCLFVNTITFEWLNIGWWNLVARFTVRKICKSKQSDVGTSACHTVRQ